MYKLKRYEVISRELYYKRNLNFNLGKYQVKLELSIIFFYLNIIIFLYSKHQLFN